MLGRFSDGMRYREVLISERLANVLYSCSRGVEFGGEGDEAEIAEIVRKGWLTDKDYAIMKICRNA